MCVRLALLYFNEEREEKTAYEERMIITSPALTSRNGAKKEEGRKRGRPPPDGLGSFVRGCYSFEAATSPFEDGCGLDCRPSFFQRFVTIANERGG